MPSGMSNTDMATLKNQLKAAQAARKEAEENLAQLQEQTSAAWEQLQELTAAEKAQWEADLAEAKAKQADAESRYAELQARTHEAKNAKGSERERQLLAAREAQAAAEREAAEVRAKSDAIIAKLETELNATKDELAELLEHGADARDELEAFKAETAEAWARHQEQVQADLAQARAEAAKEQEALVAKTADQAAQLLALRREFADKESALQAELAATKDKLAETSQAAQQAQDKHGAADARLAAAEQGRAEAEAALAAFKKETAAAWEEHDRIEGAEKKYLQAELEAAREHTQRTDKELAELRDTLRTLQRERDIACDELEDAKRHKERANREALEQSSRVMSSAELEQERLRGELEALTAKLGGREAELQELRERQAKQLEQHTKELDALHQELSAARKDKAEAELDADRVKKQAAGDLQRKDEAHAIALSSLHKQLDALRSDDNALGKFRKESAAEQERMLQQHAAEVARLQNELDTARKSEAKWRRELDDLREESQGQSKSADARLAELEGKHAALVARLHAKEAELAQAQRQAQDKSEAAKKEIDGLHRALEEALDVHNDASRELTLARRKLQAHRDKEASRLKATLTFAKEQSHLPSDTQEAHDRELRGLLQMQGKSEEPVEEIMVLSRPPPDSDTVVNSARDLVFVEKRGGGGAGGLSVSGGGHSRNPSYGGHSRNPSLGSLPPSSPGEGSTSAASNTPQRVPMQRGDSISHEGKCQQLWAVVEEAQTLAQKRIMAEAEIERAKQTVLREQLRDENERLKATIAGLHTERTDLLRQLRANEVELEAATKQGAAASAALQAKEEELHKALSKARAAEDDKRGTGAELGLAQQQNELLVREAALAKEQVAQLQQAIEADKAAQQELQKRLGETEAQLESANRELGKKQSEAKLQTEALEDELESMRRHEAELAERLRRALEDNKADRDMLMASHDKEIKRLQEDIADLLAQKGKTAAKLASSDTDRSLAQKLLAEREAQLAQLQQELGQAQQQHALAMAQMQTALDEAVTHHNAASRELARTDALARAERAAEASKLQTALTVARAQPHVPANSKEEMDRELMKLSHRMLDHSHGPEEEVMLVPGAVLGKEQHVLALQRRLDGEQVVTETLRRTVEAPPMVEETTASTQSRSLGGDGRSTTTTTTTTTTTKSRSGGEADGGLPVTVHGGRSERVAATMREAHELALRRVQAEHEADMARLAEEKGMSERTLAELDKQRQALERERDFHQQESRRQAGLVQELSDEVDDVRARLRQSEAQNRRALGEATAAQRDAQARVAELELALAQAGSSKEGLRDMQGALQQARESAGDAWEAAEKAAQRVKALEALSRQMEEDAAHLRRKEKNASRELETARDEADKHARDAAAVKAELAALQTQTAQTVAAQAETISNLQSRLKIATAQLSRLQEEVVDLQDEATKIAAREQAAMQEELGALKAKLEAARRRERSAVDELDEYKQRLGAGGVGSSSSRELVELQQSQQLVEDVTSATRKLRALERSLEEAEQKIRQRERELAALQPVKAERDRLQRELNLLQDARAAEVGSAASVPQLEGEIGRLRAALRAAEENKELLESEGERLRRRLREALEANSADEEMAHLRTHARRTVEKLQGEVAGLEAELRAVKRRALRAEEEADDVKGRARMAEERLMVEIAQLREELVRVEGNAARRQLVEMRSNQVVVRSSVGAEETEEVLPAPERIAEGISEGISERALLDRSFRRVEREQQRTVGDKDSDKDKERRKKRRTKVTRIYRVHRLGGEEPGDNDEGQAEEDTYRRRVHRSHHHHHRSAGGHGSGKGSSNNNKSSYYGDDEGFVSPRGTQKTLSLEVHGAHHFPVEVVRAPESHMCGQGWLRTAPGEALLLEQDSWDELAVLPYADIVSSSRRGAKLSLAFGDSGSSSFSFVLESEDAAQQLSLCMGLE